MGPGPPAITYAVGDKPGAWLLPGARRTYPGAGPSSAPDLCAGCTGTPGHATVRYIASGAGTTQSIWYSGSAKGTVNPSTSKYSVRRTHEYFLAQEPLVAYM